MTSSLAEVIGPAERQALLEEEQVRAAKEFLGLFSGEAPPVKARSMKTPPTQDRELSREVANLAIEAFQREEVSSGYLRDLGEKLGIPGAKLVEAAA